MAASTVPGGPPAQPGQRRAGVSPMIWIAVLVVALAGGAYLLYKRSSSASSAAAAGTSTDTTDTPAGTTSPDWSGEIATLQTEIGDLQSTEAQQDQDSKTGTSGSTAQVTVPGVVGYPQVEAIQVLNAKGLKGSGTKPTKGKVLYVTAQDPKAGAKADKGSTVKLTTELEPGKKKTTAKKTPAKTTAKTTARAPASDHAKTATKAVHKTKGGHLIPVGKAAG